MEDSRRSFWAPNLQTRNGQPHVGMFLLGPWGPESNRSLTESSLPLYLGRLETTTVFCGADNLQALRVGKSPLILIVEQHLTGVPLLFGWSSSK